MLSITIDPAIAFNLIRVVGTLTIIAFSGFLFVYYAFGLRSLAAAFAIALPIGLAATLLVCNLLAYLLGTPRAFSWGLLLVLAAALSLAFLTRRAGTPKQPSSWHDCALLIAASVVLLFLSTANYAIFTTWDYHMHYWLANTIRFGNFPVMAPGSPTMLAEYHYGVDLLAAMLAHIGQLDSAIVFFILTPLAATAAYVAASALAARILGSFRRGLIAGLFFSFAGGMPYLIAPVRMVQLRWFTPLNAAAENELITQLLRISPWEFEAYPNFIVVPHYLVAWAILFSCILLVSHLDSSSKSAKPWARWYHWSLLGVLFASIALMETSVFVLGLLGWAAFALWRAATQREFLFLRNHVLAAVPLALLALLQGGVFTAALVSASPVDAGLFDTISLRFVAEATGGGTPNPESRYRLLGIVTNLITLGLPFLAAPVLLIWALISKHRGPLTWLATIGLASMLIPQVFVYNYSADIRRFIDFGLASFAFLLGIAMMTLVSQLRYRSLAWAISVAVAGLTITSPLAASIGNITNQRPVSLGHTIESLWTISPPFRRSDNIDWISGRAYPFRMGGETQEFLRSLPSTARVLTNQFPEVPLLIRGTAPHKSVDTFSYNNFHFPSPDYFDALYALDPVAMEQYGITHLVINLMWFRNSSPTAHELLRNPRYFSLIFSNEETQEGFAWHHVYQVLPAFYAERPGPVDDLLHVLPNLIPVDATVYVSPAIPEEVRWALLYTLRDRQLKGNPTVDSHIKTRVVVSEPHPDDRYDFALLIDEPPGDRWLNWQFTPKDLPSVWGLHPSQQIWHSLGVGLYTLVHRECPNRAYFSVPPAWHLPANSLTALDLDCLDLAANGNSSATSVLLTVLAQVSTHIEITADGSTRSFSLDPGATLIPLDMPRQQRITLNPTDQVWVHAQRVPPNSNRLQSGIAALQVLPFVENGIFTANVRIFGMRLNPQDDQLFWELIKQRHIYGHTRSELSSGRVGIWKLALEEPPDHGSHYAFALDSAKLNVGLTANGQPAKTQESTALPDNPGEPYVLYFTLVRRASRVHSLPVAWITYSATQEPSVTLAPRFILVDTAISQD